MDMDVDVVDVTAVVIVDALHTIPWVRLVGGDPVDPLETPPNSGQLLRVLVLLAAGWGSTIRVAAAPRAAC